MNGASELVVPERPAVETLLAALGSEFAVRVGETSVRDRVYLDSFDARLRAVGLTLRLERGRFELFDGDEELPSEAALAIGAPDGPVLGDELPPGPLRDRVAPLLGVRALMPLTRVRLSVSSLAVLDDLEKTVARVTIESPELLDGGRRAGPLGTRLRLRGVRGYETELSRVGVLLDERLAARAAPRALADELILASGGSPEGVSPKIDVALNRDERADRAVIRVLERLLEIIAANLSGTISDADPEFLHDLRVSVRRTRAVQRELKRVFPPDALRRARDDFKWLQEVTGEARDLDVHVLGFEATRALVPEALQADLEPVLGVLRMRRAAAHRAMVRELRSGRFARMMDEWSAMLEDLVELPDTERSDAGTPIGELAARRIRKVYGHMVKMGSAIGAGSAPEDFHALRKKGKELRYLLELFGETAVVDGSGSGAGSRSGRSKASGAKEVKRMIKTLKSLQDVLGHHQDREVQMAMLRALAEAVAAAPGGSAALMATGVLLERLEKDAADARAAFAETFATFAAKPQRRLVHDTFR